MTRRTINLQTSLVLLLIVLTFFIFEVTDIDIYIQSQLYNFETNSWIVDKKNAIAYLLFYSGIKVAIISSVVMFFIVAFLFRNSSWVNYHREAIFILALSVILVPTTIGSMKEITNMPCPKNISIYGGKTSYYKLLSEDHSDGKKFNCFPAGHAGAGFALLALIFFAKNKKQQWFIASAVLALGWLMGGYKMMIGHHFLSHTIISMLLSWLLILQFARFVFCKKLRHSHL